MMSLSTNSVRAARAILIAPTPRLIDETTKFAERVELAPKELVELRRDLEEHFGADIWERTDLLALAPNVRVETLIIHDELDPDVPFVEAPPLAKALESGELHSTRGFGHVSILRAAPVVDRAIEYMVKR